MAVALHEFVGLSFDDALRAAAELVARDGVSPTEAARKVIEVEGLSSEALYEFAARGMGLALGSEIHAQMRRSRPEYNGENGSPPGADLRSIFARYRKPGVPWRDLRYLLAPYEGADGKTKPLLSFDHADVVYLRDQFKRKAHGYMRLNKVLGTIAAEIGGGLVSDLPATRLRELDVLVGEAFS